LFLELERSLRRPDERPRLVDPNHVNFEIGKKMDQDIEFEAIIIKEK
jgi:hypothetical protein